MLRKYRMIIAVLLVIGACYILLRIPVVRQIVFIVAAAYIISYALNPIHKKIKSFGVNGKLSAAMLITGVIALFIGTVVSIIPGLFKESMTISNTLLQFRVFFDGFNDHVSLMQNNKIVETMFNTAYEKINIVVMAFFERLLERLLSFAEHLFSLAVIPILVYYFLSEMDRIGNKILMIVPGSRRNIVKKICSDIDKILSRYIISQLFLSMIIGVISFFILLFLKVDYPLLLSIINALFNIIPYFGPLLGAIPAVLMALLISPMTALWTAICLYLIQQIEGDIISPKITGDSVCIHPLIVILLLIVGGEIGGFLGMVLAVPVGVVIKIVYEDLDYYLF